MTNDISGKTLVYAFLADPSDHTLSPKMYNTSFEALKMDAVYVAFNVGQEALSGAIDGVRNLGIRGINLSKPDKEAVIPLLDEVSDEADLIGAVNTVTNMDGKGHLVGYNTDGKGCMKDLEAHGIEVKGKTITMAGFGGAGEAIACQAALDGANAIHLFNRRGTKADKAAEINEKTSCHVTLNTFSEKEIYHQAIESADIYINSTNVGMGDLEGQCLIDDPSVLHSDLVVYDVIYSPRETVLLKLARQQGVKQAINGLGMLLYQGALAFHLFTGEEMPIDLVKKALFEA